MGAVAVLEDDFTLLLALVCPAEICEGHTFSSEPPACPLSPSGAGLLLFEGSSHGVDAVATLEDDLTLLLAFICLRAGGGLDGPGRSEELRGVGRGERTGVSRAGTSLKKNNQLANVIQTTQRK